MLRDFGIPKKYIDSIWMYKIIFKVNHKQKLCEIFEVKSGLR